jgi:hypothetical protein
LYFDSIDEHESPDITTVYASQFEAIPLCVGAGAVTLVAVEDAAAAGAATQYASPIHKSVQSGPTAGFQA